MENKNKTEQQTITIDGEKVVLADLPATIQNQIALYEHTAVKLVEARKELGVLETARAALAQQVALSYQQHKDEEAKKVDEVPEEVTDSADVD